MKEAAMSRRHRDESLAPLARADLRAHAHNERHRVHSELHLVTEAVRHGLEPIDVEEPGPEWKPEHHHQLRRAPKRQKNDQYKHWKIKSWKRRKAVRRQRAIIWTELAKEA